MNGVAGSSQARQITNPGSKILLSKLPTDVTEKEVDVRLKAILYLVFTDPNFRNYSKRLSAR